jgi:regulator of extracellular matrix RemA (YlzA/DUF370 family)
VTVGERRFQVNNPVNIGYGNMVMTSKVVAVLSPDSAPMRRLKEEAKERRMLIDATQGRKTRAIIITDSVLLLRWGDGEGQTSQALVVLV